MSGSAPLLISRSALKTLNAALDFQHDRLKVFGDTAIPVKINSAGQYVVDLMDRREVPSSSCTEFTEIMISEPKIDPEMQGDSEPVPRHGSIP